MLFKIKINGLCLKRTNDSLRNKMTVRSEMSNYNFSNNFVLNSKKIIWAFNGKLKNSTVCDKYYPSTV